VQADNNLAAITQASQENPAVKKKLHFSCERLFNAEFLMLASNAG
jgi:hypothetical protein